jgi:hypothetical protein
VKKATRHPWRKNTLAKSPSWVTASEDESDAIDDEMRALGVQVPERSKTEFDGRLLNTTHRPSARRR